MRHRISLTTLATAFILLCVQPLSHAAITIKSVINPGNPGPIINKPFDQVQFDNYVEACKAELGFDAIPQMDCNDINFRNPDGTPEFSRSTDYVTHAKINSVVDAVFACRWVHPNEGPGVNGDVPTGAIVAASGEMLVHNKVTGGTCFFKMKPGNTAPANIDFATADHYERIATTNPPSPTDPDGFSFWHLPSKLLDANAACTTCHAAGPWIASPQIVGALAQFGLINDGHDIKHERYTAIGSNGATLNQYAQKTLAANLNTCANECHVLAAKDLRGDDGTSFGFVGEGSFIVIPSITRVIDDVMKGQHMPPTTDMYSDYRWVNRDDSRYLGDYERLSDIHREYPQFYCSNPTSLQVHEVDSTIVMATDDLPNVLNTFNLYDGLICVNAEQGNGKKCANYETRYRCNGRWTAWNSTDTPGATGDFERRSKFPGLCANPTSMQARVVNTSVRAYAPRDRLATFSPEGGLVCRNADQPSGQCNDYTVRFICPQ